MIWCYYRKWKTSKEHCDRLDSDQHVEKEYHKFLSGPLFHSGNVKWGRKSAFDLDINAAHVGNLCDYVRGSERGNGFVRKAKDVAKTVVTATTRSRCLAKLLISSRFEPPVVKGDLFFFRGGVTCQGIQDAANNPALSPCSFRDRFRPFCWLVQKHIPWVCTVYTYVTSIGFGSNSVL